MPKVTGYENPIKFRTKFLKRFDYDDDILNRLSKTILELINEPEDYLINLLWKLTYNPDDYAYLIGFSTCPFSYNETYLPYDLVVPVRNEIRYHYMESGHPNFSVVEVPADCEEPFSILKAKIDKEQDLQPISSVVLTVILVACNKVVHNPSTDINRCIFLLKSDNEKNFFGGLRSIGFCSEEAQTLKPLAHEIGIFLESLYQESLHSRYVSTGEVSSEKVSDEDTSRKNIQEENSDIISKFTVQLIVENESLFSDFLAICNTMRTSGFDPEKAIDNADAISSILSGIKALK